WLASNNNCRPRESKGPITTGIYCLAKPSTSFSCHDRRGVWVPAFAGTTTVWDCAHATSQTELLPERRHFFVAHELAAFSLFKALKHSRAVLLWHGKHADDGVFVLERLGHRLAPSATPDASSKIPWHRPRPIPPPFGPATHAHVC